MAKLVMPGLKGEARLRADDPGIQAFPIAAKTWMAGTSPAMTEHSEIPEPKKIPAATRPGGYDSLVFLL
jgi:hypothetical protein